ncbi:ANTAR domain-containing protein [Streptomyces sp. NPDC001068]|uniref:ANTAR domain-containing protein n=1 Tax=Streptomyces sp. NPDC001068 TaxID=3364544 RepID=UPI0036A904E2
MVISVGSLCPDEGFEVLRRVSQRTNTKLRHFAELIVNWPGGGELPDDLHLALDEALKDARSR